MSLFRNIFRNKKQATTEEAAEEFEKISERFTILLNQIEEAWGMLDAWEFLISNEEVFEKYNKKWIALSLALQLYRVCIRNPNEYSQKREESLPKINQLFPELAKEIKVLGNMPSKKELEVLVPIFNMLNQNEETAINYIRTDYEKIMQKVEEFNDRETARELRRIMTLISGQEIDELSKCIADIHNWTRYRLAKNRTEFFTERLAVYVKGGTASDGADYLGIASHFKDGDLARNMFSIPAVKKLWTYKQEIKFFEWARDVILKSLREQGRWEGFYEFYNNLRKGKNYIRIVREKFGNEEFAALLEGLHEKIHENPELWAQELQQIDAKLRDETYQNKQVIIPAAEALIALFESRIGQIKTQKERETKDLREFLARKIEQIQHPESKIKNKFLRILARNRKKLKRELKDERLRFKLYMADIVNIIPDFVSNYLKVSNINTRQEIIQEKKILSGLSAWSQFLQDSVGPLSYGEVQEGDNIVKSSTRAIAAAYRKADIAKKELELKKRFEEKFAHNLSLLKEMVLNIENDLFPNIEKLKSQISGKLNDFVPDLINSNKEFVNLRA